jgi:hypothetical protein
MTIHIPFAFMRVVAQELWTPAEITTLGWWDCSDTATITHSSNSVSQIDEKKGGVNLIQTTGSLQPTTNTRTQNGLNVLDFDGTEQMNMTGNGDFPIAQPTNVTFISVHGVDVINNNNDSLWATVSAGNDYQFESNINSTFEGEISMSNNINLVLSPTPNNGPSVYALRFSRDDPNTSAWVDGNDRGSTGVMNNNLGPACQIKIMTSRGTDRVDGFWGEMVVTNDNTTDTRQKLEGYMAWRWGLQGNLPVGHPYKDAAPTV